MASSAAAPLPFRPDSYNGVIIDPTQTQASPAAAPSPDQPQVEPPPFPTDPEAFGRALDAALAGWKAEGKRGVWLKARHVWMMEG